MAQPAPVESKLLSCPLSSAELVDLVINFVDLYNEQAAQIQLYTYQRLFMRRIIESLLLHDGQVMTGLWSRQSGKSETIASLAGGLCIVLPALAAQFPGDQRLADFSRGFWVGVFAPRLQQSGYIYQRIRERAEKDTSASIYQDPDINIELTVSRGDQVSWNNGSFCRSQTASEQSNVEGSTYHLVILDEAQLISRSKVQKEIMPMLAATNGSCVKIGTAHVFRGGFHDSITHNMEKAEAGGPRNHFEFPYEIVIAEKRKKYEETLAKGEPNPFHLKYEAWVSAELDRLGGNIENEEFKMNFRLLWQELSLGAVDRDAFFYDCPEERLEIGEVRMFCRQVAGLDLGKVNDYTVLTVLEMGDVIEYPGINALVRPGEEPPVFRENLIVGWCRPDHGLWKDQLKELIQYLNLFAVDTIAVDATGKGDPIAEQLVDLLPGLTIIPVNWNIVTKDNLYKRYLQEISTGRLRYAAGPQTRETDEFRQFVRQHEDLEKVYHGRYMSPSAPEGGHDDFCDSGALAVYASTIEGATMSEVECTSNPFYANRGSQQSSRAERYRGRRQ